jgi:hypothetical protein
MKRPAGVTLIAILFFVTAVPLLLSPGMRIRGIGLVSRDWLLVISAICIALGIGMLARLKWIHPVVIAVLFLRVAVLGVSIMNGELHGRTVVQDVSYVFGGAVAALIIIYLLRPEIGRTFT